MTRLFFKQLLYAGVAVSLGFFLLIGCDSQNNEKAGSSQMEEPQNVASSESKTEKPGGDETLFENQVVATVNGVPIKRSILESQVMMADTGNLILDGDAAQQEPDAAKAHDLAIRAEILRILIDLELASQDAAKAGYSPTDAEVAEAMAAYKSDEEYPDGFNKALDRFGETEESFREHLVKTLSLKKWQDIAFISQIKVSDEEAKAFYEQNIESMKHGDLIKVRQVFIGVPLTGDQVAKDKALQLAKKAMAEIKTGADFKAVAAKYSNEPDAKADGGDMGWLPAERPHPFISQDIFKLDIGAVSDIVESPIGYHIFKMTDKKAAGTEPFNEIKMDIVDFLSGGKLMEAVTVRLEELREKADIKILDKDLAQVLEGSADNSGTDASTEKNSGDGKEIPSNDKN